MDQIPPEILNALPPKWKANACLAVAVYYVIDHVIKIVFQNEGLVGLWRKLLHGTPESKKIEQIDEHLRNTDSIATEPHEPTTAKP